MSREPISLVGRIMQLMRDIEALNRRTHQRSRLRIINGGREKGAALPAFRPRLAHSGAS